MGGITWMTPSQLGITDPKQIKEIKAMQEHVQKKFVGSRPVTQRNAYDLLPNVPGDQAVRHQIGALVIKEKYIPEITKGETPTYTLEVFPSGDFQPRPGKEYPTWHSVKSENDLYGPSRQNRRLGDGFFSTVTFSDGGSTPITPTHNSGRRVIHTVADTKVPQ
jgi:hypothetical protein